MASEACSVDLLMTLLLRLKLESEFIEFEVLLGLIEFEVLLGLIAFEFEFELILPDTSLECKIST